MGLIPCPEEFHFYSGKPGAPTPGYL